MIESWLPAIFAIVIVLGMVAARVWSTLVSQTLPVVRDWAIERRRGGDRFHQDLALRIQDLEEQVQFLEELLQAAGS